MGRPGEARARRARTTSTGVLLASLLAWPANAADSTPRAPNIVLIVADDLGYGDLGCYGNTRIRTPALDRMAATGTRLTEFYTPAPTCSPARAALLTGRHPLRTGMTRVFIPKEKLGLPHAELTIAEHLRDAGYATACIGKWHLGGRKPFRPQRHGFDSFYGVLYSHDMVWLKRLQWPRFELFDGPSVVESPARPALLTRRYTDQAIRFIERNRDRPFFLYLAYTMPHLPLAASDAFAGRSRHGAYGDAVEELDAHVGQLLRALAKSGLDNDTYAFFTSDNGPWTGAPGMPGGSTAGLRGAKGTTWEGGLRVPFVARAPGHLPAGAVRTGAATLLDLFPTISAAVGAPLPDGRAYDGRNLLPLLRGAETAARTLIFSHRRKVHAVRAGSWKLHLYERPVGANGRLRKTRKLASPRLYHLDRDPSEERDAAAEHPTVTRRLTRNAASFQASVEPTVRLPSYFRSVARGLLSQAPQDDSPASRRTRPL